MSTLCAGCGHDSITGSIMQAAFELSIPPHRMAKLSGIGCSSKTPAYFASASHGFNTVHGRMPSVATGANAANQDLHYIGVSGDGDTLSIGLGQFLHHAKHRQRRQFRPAHGTGEIHLINAGACDLRRQFGRGSALGLRRIPGRPRCAGQTQGRGHNLRLRRIQRPTPPSPPRLMQVDCPTAAPSNGGPAPCRTESPRWCRTGAASLRQSCRH